jgi:hypothetical protein
MPDRHDSTRPELAFCTLALRPKYRQMAWQLAADIALYAPGVTLVVVGFPRHLLRPLLMAGRNLGQVEAELHFSQ